MKIIGMIPARMGSSRVIKKNLRLLNNKPLIQYIIEAASQISFFDKIYVNSEDPIFASFCKKYDLSFYNRPNYLSTDSATNDEFAKDFLENIECDILIQMLPTSPFLTSDDIYNFIQYMLQKKYETLISVEHKQIACVLDRSPINFEKLKKNPPSQSMTPVKVYATALMGWRSDRFLMNMKKYNSAYHGGEGTIGYFELKGLSTIDIDTEEDFRLAETIMIARSIDNNEKPKYYSDISKLKQEIDVESILIKDGVKNNDLFDVNKELVNIQEIIGKQPIDISWSKRVVDTENNSMTIIAQMPGEGNRKHYHPNWNEWWYIFDGEWEWEIEGNIKKIKKGDIVFMKKGRVHKITASGEKQAIRLAISRSDVSHIYTEN